VVTGTGKSNRGESPWSRDDKEGAGLAKGTLKGKQPKGCRGREEEGGKGWGGGRTSNSLGGAGLALERKKTTKVLEKYIG